MIETLSHGITCIDTGYHRAGLAACYLVVDEGEAALIETGTALNLPAILQALAECDVAPQQLRYIIPTHVHLDHAGGAGALLARCPQATLVAHPRGARHLIDPERLIAGAKAVYGDESFTRMYGDIVPAPAERVREAADGSRWTLGRRELLVRDTPGHARHHFCLWDETSRGWFTGDTFGIGYRELHCRGEPYLIPTTTPVQFEPGALLASIELLMAAEPRYCYLTHFGRIAASARHAESLRRQIRDYVRFAEGVDIGADGAQSALTEALMTYTVDGLRAAGSTLPVTTLRALLALDMDLSAQGLVHWMRHR
jgi:glyoxylase-like metal-dependent hydrolase (beta-lactamase superfamily II)